MQFVAMKKPVVLNAVEQGLFEQGDMDGNGNVLFFRDSEGRLYARIDTAVVERGTVVSQYVRKGDQYLDENGRRQVADVSGRRDVTLEKAKGFKAGFRDDDGNSIEVGYSVRESSGPRVAREKKQAAW